jgi:hypothetical protein
MLRTILLLCLMPLCITAQKLYTPADEWAIKINDGWFTAKTITFGAYTTADRKNGVADAASVSFAKDPINPFNFKVRGEDQDILIQAMGVLKIAFSSRSLPNFLHDLPDTSPFYYALINGTKNDPLKRWELILKNSTYMELNDDKPAGVLRTADEELKITAHNHFGTVNSYENICFEFHYRKLLAAAVITGAKPRIWMDPATPDWLRPVIAAAAGALLLR